MDKNFTVNGVPFTMIYVEGGTFMMGTQEEWCEGIAHEHPLHSVTLDSYYIAETEVTQELWERVTGKNPSSDKGSALCCGKCDMGRLPDIHQKIKHSYRHDLPSADRG